MKKQRNKGALVVGLAATAAAIGGVGSALSAGAEEPGIGVEADSSDAFVDAGPGPYHYVRSSTITHRSGAVEEVVEETWRGEGGRGVLVLDGAAFEAGAGNGVRGDTGLVSAAPPADLGTSLGFDLAIARSEIDALRAELEGWAAQQPAWVGNDGPVEMEAAHLYVELAAAALADPAVPPAQRVALVEVLASTPGIVASDPIDGEGRALSHEFDNGARLRTTLVFDDGAALRSVATEVLGGDPQVLADLGYEVGPLTTRTIEATAVVEELVRP